MDILMGVTMPLAFLSIVMIVAVVLTADGLHEKLNAILDYVMWIISIPAVIMMVVTLVYGLISGGWQ